MTIKTISILIGGILPALLFGISAIFQKPSTQAGIGLGPYIIIIGLGVVIAGLVLLFVWPDRGVSLRSGGYASLVGLFWGFAMGMVGIALIKYQAPISRLVPLYNMNTLVAVLLALTIFSEWRDVSMLKLISGAILIIVGGILVSLA